MTETGGDELKNWLARNAGLDPSLLDRPSFASFVQRRRSELELADDQAYLNVLRASGQELEGLIQEVSVAETSFFRYAESFQLLVSHLAKPELRRNRDSLRMLSIACATGEEPYSMVMAAAQAGWPLEQVSVDAVDRHSNWLAVARRAIYQSHSVRQELPEWSLAWLEQSQREFKVDARIVDRVTFIHADILTWPTPSQSDPYDVIFCRNLLIYLNQAARERLIARVASWLGPQGLLFVGHAEHLESFRSRFRAVDAPRSFALAPIQSQAATQTKEKDKAPRQQRESAKTRQSRTRPQPWRPQTRPSEPSPEKPEPAKRPDPIPSIEVARGLADDGKLLEAQATLEALLAANHPNAQIYELLGSIHLGLGQPSQAREALQKVLYFEPRHEAALLQLAMIHHQQGDEQQAERYRRRAARVHHDQPE